MTNSTAPIAAADAHVAKQSTANLEAALQILSGRAALEPAERAAKAWIADELSRRFDLTEKLDAIYDDIDFDGTIYDAYRLARAVATKRGELLTQYGFNRRWVRWDRPVRVVDAFPRRAGHYLGWVYADLPPGERAAVVRISETNFRRFYKEVHE